jgi:hypothetical protein
MQTRPRSAHHDHTATERKRPRYGSGAASREANLMQSATLHPGPAGTRPGADDDAGRLRQLESALEHLSACRRDLDDYRARGAQLDAELTRVPHAA